MYTLSRCCASASTLTGLALLDGVLNVTSFVGRTSFRFHDILFGALKACDFDKISSYRRE